MAGDENQFTIAEMIGKNATSTDNIIVGKITKIIDQSDSDEDDTTRICDIQTDFFQVVVQLDPAVFPALSEATDILFSSQTLEKVLETGIQLKLTKDKINESIEASIR